MKNIGKMLILLSVPLFLTSCVHHSISAITSHKKAIYAVTTKTTSYIISTKIEQTVNKCTGKGPSMNCKEVKFNFPE